MNEDYEMFMLRKCDNRHQLIPTLTIEIFSLNIHLCKKIFDLVSYFNFSEILHTTQNRK